MSTTEPQRTTPATNEAVVRAIYAAVAAGDVDAVVAHLDPRVVAHQAASLPYAGTYHGPDGFRAMAAGITAAWDGFQTTPEQFVAAGDRVVVLAEMRGRPRVGGAPWTMPLAEVWTLAGGRVTDVRPFYWDTAVLGR